MRTLERITVTGYKSIRELRGEDGQGFVLSDINVLIGANGAGKSNFLSVFKLLNSIVNKRLRLYVANAPGRANSLLHFGRKVTSEIQLELVLPEVDYKVTLAPTEDDRLHLSENLGRYFSSTQQVIPYLFIDNLTVSVGVEESLLYGELHENNSEAKKNLDRVLCGLPSWQVYHFDDTSAGAPVKQTGDVFDNRFLRPDAKNLAAFLYRLQQDFFYCYKRIVQTIRLAAPFFDDFLLNPDSSQNIRLRWLHKNADEDFDLSLLSDGTLRFICLTTLLLQPNPPSLIIIDEPELGLHPAPMELFVEMLRSVATKSQVIISTQSVSMVSQFFPEEVIVVDREKDTSLFRRLNTKDLEIWLEDYSLGEIWKMNLVGGRPR